MQYWHWLSGVLTGDLGSSIILKESVGSLLAGRVLTVGDARRDGIGDDPVGRVSPWASRLPRWGRVFDFAALATTTVLMAAPAFVSAIVLIWIFSTKLSWLPVYGTGDGFWDSLRHLVLPAIALSLSYLAFVSRITRTEVRGELGSEHVEAARARGVGRAAVVRRHVLRNVSPGILSVSAITFAGLFAGTAVVEQAFGISGLGSLLVQSAARQDVVVVQSLSLLLVGAFVIVNLGVDIVNALLDPRLLRGRVAA